jgi:hypothetical protein
LFLFLLSFCFKIMFVSKEEVVMSMEKILAILKNLE